MEFFRAVPAEGFDSEKRYFRQPTRRLPSNIPYVIDNIWEYLKPTSRPSRRHAVYASPTPELALDNASAGYLRKAEYVVCRLEFAEEPAAQQLAVMQLAVSDARNHADIKKLQKIVHETLGMGFGSLPMADKLGVAPLFLPGASVAELDAALNQSQQVLDILSRASKASTFWHGALELDPESDGELLFELADSNSYTLRPVQFKIIGNDGKLIY